MKYYVMGIEQTLVDGEYSEFSSAPKKYNDLNSARVYFFTRLAELVNSSVHTYAQLKIVDSRFIEVPNHKFTIGEYVNVDAMAE